MGGLFDFSDSFCILTMEPIRLLLVENNEDQAMLVSYTLGRYDHRFQVTVVESGEACLAALGETDFELLLLDYGLPRASGLEVLREIRQAGYQTPVVMMTPHGDEATAVDAMKAGATDYIVKQSDYLTQLVPTVNRVLRYHRLEAELALSQQRYRLLFESSRDAILILDSEDRIIDLNPKAETLLGASRDDALGQRLFAWIRLDQPEQVATWLQQLHHQGGESGITASFVNREGLRRWVEMVANWLGEPERRGHYQLLLLDVAQARRDQDVWKAFNRAALAAHNQLAPESIYQAVAHVLLELGLASSMWWLDEERQALQVRYTTYPQQMWQEFAEKIGLDVRNLWVPVDRLTIFRDQVMKGETVYLRDGGELVRQIVDSDDQELVDRAVDIFDVGAIILVPFVILDKLAGMLLIHGDLSEQSVPAGRAFAGQISSALEQARLYHDAQRRIRELAALQEISFKLSSTLEIPPLMKAITEVALQLTDAHNCHIYMVGDEGFEFIAARRRDGSSEPLVSQPRPDGLVARVARAAEPLFIDNAKQHPLYQTPVAQEWGVDAVAGCPLLRGGHVLGVFTLTFLEPHRFGQAERHILSLLADQAAVAIETAQLYQDLKRRNDDLSTLYEISLAVSAQVNISDVLEAAYEAVSRATGARTFAVGLYNEDGDELVFKIIREEGEVASHPNLPVTDGPGLTAWVARNRRELIINDMQSEPLPVPGVTVGVPVRSWVGFPLIAGERLVGVMSIQSRHPNAFDEGHQRLCQSIATQLAIALEKAHLLEEVQQHNWELSVLNEVSAAASHAFDMETLLDGALTIVLDALRLDAGAFHLLHEDNDVLTLAKHRNLHPDAVREVQEIALGEGICGRVAVTGEAIITDEGAHDSGWLSQSLSNYSCMASIPLSSKDVVIGTLSVLNLKPHQFTLREVGLLIAIGQQLGVAVENAMLYRKTIDRERRLTRLNEAARSLSSVLEAQMLFRRVLETAIDELPASGALLWLRENETGLSPQLALGSLADRGSKVGLAARAEIESVLRGKERVLWGNRANPQQWIGGDVIGKRGYCAAVPLRGQTSEIGVLEVVTASERDWLTDDDLEFLSTLGGIAAIAYENAQLYEAVAQYAVSLEAKIDDRTAEVRREKDQTEAILRSVADGIFVFGDHGRMLLTNPAAELLLDVSAEQAARLRDFLGMVAQQPGSDAPGPTITLDGQTLQARAAKIRQQGVELGTVIVLRDVTHYEEVNRLKSEFVSTVSHELRTPLANLKLYLSLLERGRAEKRSAYQRVLAQEVNRLENLIQDLLDLSELETRGISVDKEKINLWEVVSHVLTVLDPQADGKRIALTGDCEVGEGRLWVSANREQMVQLIINLVANAINYTEPNGRVLLRLNTQTDLRGRWVVVSVQDTGVGIAAADQPRIFDRFFRGKVQQHMSPGTGLGLAIVKEILDRHEGWITVESQLGIGSVFTIGLPAAAPPDHEMGQDT